MEVAEQFIVEVVYALPVEQCVLQVRVCSGATVESAIRASGLLRKFPQIDLARAAIGIFSRRVGLTQPVRPGDRIEVYRRLIADPKAARRKRAGTA